jgi:hypothetical protein
MCNCIFFYYYCGLNEVQEQSTRGKGEKNMLLLLYHKMNHDNDI